MSNKAGIAIAIATYNRGEQLLQLVHILREHTNPRVPVVMFDDGGCDGSQEAVAPLVSAYIRAENRGITVNKNRALFYFCRIRPVKRVLLLEEDVLVTTGGWLKLWKRSIDFTAISIRHYQLGRKTNLSFMAGVATRGDLSAGHA